MKLSKSDYMMFLKHPAWLWLKKHDKSKLPEPDENLQAIFDAGHKFETYAEALFPNGVKLGLNDFGEYRALPERTQETLASGAEVIFQGRFNYNDLTCIIDVLKNAGGNNYHLYEIKSGTDDKPEYIEDLAFQKHVLEGAGLSITKVLLIVVNRDYIRQGEVDPEKLTKVIDITKSVDKTLPRTEANIKEALAIARSSKMPDISPRHAHQDYLKEWLEIFHNLEIDTDPYSIYALSSPDRDLIGELEDQGLILMKDIPDNFTFKRSRHRHQVEITKLNKPRVERERIKEFLDSFKFPLWFFDYETMNELVPPFDGLRPYQQYPFQYSLHVLDQPGGELSHFEFLQRDSTNPGSDLITQLKTELGSRGTILVWHDSFEKQRNQELAEIYPEQAEFLREVNERIIDLKLPFSKRWYEDARFFGSASIKYVLPVLVPDMSYQNLGISEGKTASRLWTQVVLEGEHQAKREQIFNDLLEYCKLDTLAMVKIYEFLTALV